MSKKPTYEELEQQILELKSLESERKRVEEELRLNRMLLRSVLDIVPIFICAKNLDGKFILVNKKLTDFYGSTVEAMTDVMHGDICEDKNELRVMLDDDREVIESGKPKFIPEETMENPDGSISVLETYKIPFTALSEPAVLIASNDITGRKQTEEKLQKSEEQFKLLSDLTFEGIVIHDKGIAIDVNQALLKMFNYTREEIIGKNLTELLIQPEYHNTIKENISKEIATPYEVMAGKKDGTMFPVELEARDISDGNERFRVTAFRDITQRKQAEDDRNAILYELELINRVILKINQESSIDVMAEILAKAVYEVNPGCHVAVSLYDETIGGVQIKSVIGLDKNQEKIIKALRKDPRKIKFDPQKLDKVYTNYTTGKLVLVKGGLAELMAGHIPKYQCIMAEKLMGLEAVYTAGFASAEMAKGGVVILLKKGQEIRFPSAIETLVAQTSQVIQKKQYEEQLKRKTDILVERTTSLARSVRDVEDRNRQLHQEITERKQAEEALKTAETTSRNVFLNSQIGLFRTDVNTGQLIDANDAVAQFIGYENRSELLAKPFNIAERYVDPKDREEMISLLKEHGEFRNWETRYRRNDGSIVWMRFSARAELEKGWLEGVSEDITAQKLAEDELQKLAAIVKHSREAVSLVTPDGKFIFVNEFGCNLLGIEPHDVKNLDIMDVIPENFVGLVEKEVLPALLQKGNWEGGLQYRNIKTGDIRDVYADTFSLKDPKTGEITYLANVSRDITERKRVEEKHAVLETQLRQSHKLEAVGTMVGGISHELNNILQSMFLYGGLIEEQLPDDENLKSNFKQLQNGAEKARDIVKQILTFSRKSTIDFKPQAIHAIVMEVLSLERASLPANIVIKQDIDLNCGMVLCDTTQISQIIINLCNNASHAMQEKGGELTVSLQQEKVVLENGKPEIEVLELIISDTGHGIKSDELEKIFDPFFTSKDVGEGTGLGLSVIHGIVEMMGGHISVTSEVAKGTTFSILFPVVDDVEEIHTTPEAIAPKDDSNMSILLVDDDTSIREVTQAILKRKGFAIESASDGQKALDLFKANPDKYSLIVTDLSMPIMSGIELCQAIRASGSDIPIMLSTGQLDIEDQQEYENVGITTSIQKPWTAEELIARIQEIDNK